MKLRLTSPLLLAFATVAYAGPTEDLQAAAAKLAAAPNLAYSVTTEIGNSQFPVIPSEIVAEKGGFMVTTMTFDGNSRQTVRKGEQVVTQNRDGEWMTMEELRAQFAGGGGGGGRGAGFFGGANRPDAPSEIGHLMAKLQGVRVEDGAIVGTLKPEDAATLLTFGRGGRGGGTVPAPKNAAADLKFWVKDGALAKYVVHARGTIATPNGDERDIDVTTTTEIKDVGHTKVVVPEAAKKKLGS